MTVTDATAAKLHCFPVEKCYVEPDAHVEKQ